MFNAKGDYSPPDQEAPHALVVTKSGTGLLRSGDAVPVSAGVVLRIKMMGTTNALVEPTHPRIPSTWIEHSTAKRGDVLPEDQITPAVAAMAAKKAAIEKFRAAEAAKPKPPPEPTLEQRVAALEAAAKPVA